MNTKEFDLKKLSKDEMKIGINLSSELLKWLFNCMNKTAIGADSIPPDGFPTIEELEEMKEAWANQIDSGDITPYFLILGSLFSMNTDNFVESMVKYILSFRKGKETILNSSQQKKVDKGGIDEKANTIYFDA